MLMCCITATILIIIQAVVSTIGVKPFAENSFLHLNVLSHTYDYDDVLLFNGQNTIHGFISCRTIFTKDFFLKNARIMCVCSHTLLWGYYLLWPISDPIEIVWHVVEK